MALGASARLGEDVGGLLGPLYMRQLSRLELAAWLIVAAMVFDALDGRIARLARQTSRFGEQLDSLCDAISFGVAPAAVAMSVMSEFYQGWLARLAWVACAVYVTCAVLRLARFNVHTTPDEESHRSFVGLPTPPAAGMVASFVIMHLYLVREYGFDGIGRFAMPVLLLIVGPLMVSRIRYAHLIHELTKGQRSFPFFIGLIFFAFLVIVQREYMLPLVFTAYLLSGIVGVAVGKWLDRIDAAEDQDSFFR